MKKVLKSLMTIAIAASMLVASFVAVSAEEANLATDATYSIVRLTDGPGSEEEEGPMYAGKGNGDDEGFTRLNDGWKKAAEAPPKYTVLLAGSARTHRIKFDLGSVKNVTKIDLYMKDSYRATYNGKHASNRGYNKDDGFAVYSDAAANNAVNFTLSEVSQVDDEGVEVADFYIVTLTLAEAVNTQYITVDIQAELAGKHPECEDDLYTPGAYVVSINEVEIFGGDAAGATPTESKATGTKASETKGTEATDTQATTGESVAKPTTNDPADTGDSNTAVVLAIVSIVALAGAAVVLKKKSF